MQYSIFFMQWTEKIIAQFKSVGKKSPILFQKLPKKMWENIK